MRLDVVRADGEVVYTGSAEPAGVGLALSFTIADVDRPATAPTTLSGVLDANDVRLDVAIVHDQRVGTRRTQPTARSGASGGSEKLQRAPGRAARWYRPKVMPSSALLIHITGHDRPGVTFGLTSILARHGVRVLDIGQAVIHDALALGMLVELTDELRVVHAAHRPAARSAPARRADPLRGVDVGRSTTHWVRAQGKRRFIVTVLGPRLEAADIAAVAGMLADAGLNIDRIDRLSARVPLEPDEQTPPRVCVEFSASAPAADSPIDEDDVRTRLAALTAPGTSTSRSSTTRSSAAIAGWWRSTWTRR